MGQTDRKPVVIEFNGTPGAGKTTTSLEVKKRLRDMEIREISPKKVTGYQVNYKDVILSKKIRNIYLTFLRALFLIRPINLERLRIMNMSFNYWFGIKKFCISERQRNGICILDQGIVQAFVSMAYLGKIKSNEKYYKCIRQVMDSLDNVICVNCVIDSNVSMERMRARRSNGGRLQQINDDSKLKNLLDIQKHQFEEIRDKSIKRAITINMDDSITYNADKIVEYCMQSSYILS